jgi:hypothetical protein
MHELERLTVLWEERWQALLGELDVEVARRLLAVRAEAQRMAAGPSLDPAQKEAALRGRCAWGGPVGDQGLRGSRALARRLARRPSP